MAPAGNFECLRAAIQGGADSVYFGVGNLNMRSHSANNFAPEDLAEVCRICREAGIRSYLTLNIVLYDEDLEPMREALRAAKEAGITAVIASDMAAIAYARQIGVEVHISTQLSISNISSWMRRPEGPLISSSSMARAMAATWWRLSSRASTMTSANWA